MAIFRKTNSGNILYHENGMNILPSQFECGTNGHTVCDCSKLLKVVAPRSHHERNPKTSKWFRGYSWDTEATASRPQRARAPPWDSEPTTGRGVSNYEPRMK